MGDDAPFNPDWDLLKQTQANLRGCWKEIKTIRTERDELKRRVAAYVSLDIFNTLRRHGLYDSPAYREIAERYEHALSSTSPTEAGARGKCVCPLVENGPRYWDCPIHGAPPTTEEKDET